MYSDGESATPPKIPQMLVACRGEFVTGTRAPSGAKPRVIIGSDGTAEAVPFPKANKPIARSSNDCSATGR